MKKRVLELALTAALIIGMFAPTLDVVANAADEVLGESPVESGSDSVTVINPAYADIISAEEAEEYFSQLDEELLGAGTVNITSYSVEDAAVKFRDAFTGRPSVIVFNTNANIGSSSATVKEIIHKAMSDEYAQHSSHGDYIYYNYGAWNGNGSWSGDSAKWTITFQWHTTEAQEREINVEVARIISNLQLNSKNDYEKVKSIHDYLVDSIKYINDGQDIRHGSYAGFILKGGVCQSYALCFYRLCREVGLGCRIVSGWGNGEAHAWNIVKVDGKWYLIDVTWDDPLPDGQLRYDYFLKCEDDFIGHTPDPEIWTEDFQATYPIAYVSYSSKGAKGLDLDVNPISFTRLEDAEEMSTASKDGKPSIVIFLRSNGGCYNSINQIKQTVNSSWLNDANIYAFDVDGASTGTIEWFKENYAPNSDKKITFARENGNSTMWSLVSLAGLGNSVTLPVIAMFDVNDKLQFVTTGYVAPKNIASKYMPILKPGYVFPEPTPAPTPTPKPGPTQKPGPTPAPTPKKPVTEKFTDVQNKWYVPAVQYAIDNGIMSGTTETTFGPNDPCTRAMFVKILYNAEGSPNPGPAVAFTDLKGWYADAVRWAKNKGVTEGKSATLFDGNAPASREQIAAFLFRYAQIKGKNTSQREELSKFSDTAKVSGWAKNAISWTVANKIISGSNEKGVYYLNPKNDATRAEVAQMVMKFQNVFGK